MVDPLRGNAQNQSSMVRNSLLTLSFLACAINASGQISPDMFGKDPKAVPVQLGAGADRWRFAHANAAALGHVNLKVMRESPLWGEFMREAGTKMPVGLLDDIDEIWISAPAVPQTKLAAGAPALKQPQPLVLMTGKFQNSDWKNIFKNQPGVANASALLVGELPVIALAKRRMLLPAAPASALRKRAIAMGAENDMFFTMSSLAMPPTPSGAGGPMAMFGEVKGLELGMSLRDNFKTEIRLIAAKQAADSVLGMFEMMRGQIGKGADSEKQLAEMAKNIQVDRMDDGVSFKFAMSANEIREAMAKQKDTRPSVTLDETTKIRVSEPSVMPQRVKPGKIVIQGLDEGTKEIPYNKK